MLKYLTTFSKLENVFLNYFSNKHSLKIYRNKSFNFFKNQYFFKLFTKSVHNLSSILADCNAVALHS